MGRDAWAATVDLGYRYGGVDTGSAGEETRVVLVPGAGGVARIASFGGAGARTPLWLVERLSVSRTDRTLVLVGAPSTGRFPALATQAVLDVNRVLPGWRGDLVVEVPATRTQLDEAVQASPGQYDNIAAVTTTADGSLAPGAPLRVFVNPDVFSGLKARGAQVVLSHEATHVAVAAPFATMPTWLLEGFADFVALDHAGVPVRVAASQILRRVRADGPPRGLPTAADLDPSADGLGATYEEAWLVCRFLGERFGADEVVAFYRAVDGGTSTRRAFHTVLGTTQRAFVSAWRQDLAGLARVAG